MLQLLQLPVFNGIGVVYKHFLPLKLVPVAFYPKSKRFACFERLNAPHWLAPLLVFAVVIGYTQY